MRLGRAKKPTATRRAAAAFTRYFEFPLSDPRRPRPRSSTRRALGPIDAGRRATSWSSDAERLFGARRYAQARVLAGRRRRRRRRQGAGRAARRRATSTWRFQSARDALLPWTDTARRRRRRSSALSATRELGEKAEYERLAHVLVNAFPTDTWTEEILNNLAARSSSPTTTPRRTRRSGNTCSDFPMAARVARWKIAGRRIVPASGPTAPTCSSAGLGAAAIGLPAHLDLLGGVARAA